MVGAVRKEGEGGRILKVVGEDDLLRPDFQPKTVGPLPAKTLMGGGSPISFLLDNTGSGAPLGFIIRGERPYQPGKRMSEYIIVRGERISELEVADVRHLDADECRTVIQGARVWSMECIRRNDLRGVVNVIDGLAIPAMEQQNLISGRLQKTFREIAPDIRAIASQRGIPITEGMNEVLVQRNIESAQEAVGKLNMVDTLTLFPLCAMRTDKEERDPDILRLTSAVTKRLMKLTGKD